MDVDLQLQVLSGGKQGKLLSVTTEQYVIGRSEQCDLRPKSSSVSRRHCMIRIEGSRVMLSDMKSRNGTELNGVQLDPDTSSSGEGW